MYHGYSPGVDADTVFYGPITLSNTFTQTGYHYEMDTKSI